MKILNTENAKTAKVIQCIDHPEWGNKRFNYNVQALTEGRFCSTFGTGSNEALLFESEYKFWQVIS